MPELGEDMVISASATLAGAYSQVGDMNRFDYNVAAGNVTRTPVFMRATPYTTQGADEVTATLAGFFTMADTGQGILRTAAQTKTTAFLKVLWDGTNGFTQEFKVTSRRTGAAPDAMDEQSFDLSAADDAAIVGTGPLP